MPTLGDTKLEGKKSQRYIWVRCAHCKEERWARFNKRNSVPEPLCLHCTNIQTGKKIKGRFCRENSARWSGGRRLLGKYMYVSLPINSPYIAMAGKRKTAYVMEHRYVMAQHIGRCLHKWELVHHKNGDKTDNRIENLELSMWGAHTTMHNKGYKDGYQNGLKDGRIVQIKILEQRIIQLEAELSLLSSRLNDVNMAQRGIRAPASMM